MTAPSFLLFDLGGVLIENTGFARLDALLPAPIGLDALKRRWLESGCVRRFELGQSTTPLFARALIAEWKLACSADALIDEIRRWAKGFFPGARELLAALRLQHRIGCLSNSNALHWEKFDGFASLFDVTLSSHLIELIKPDDACFAHAVEACAVPASDILYFDDAMANVVAARRHGIDAVCVEGLGELRTALHERRLLGDDATSPWAGR